MHKIAREEFPRVCVLTVTDRDDGRRSETISATKGIIANAMERGVKIFLWSATPCTGGCPYQKLHLQKQGQAYKGHLNALWTCHKQLWQNFCQLDEVHARVGCRMASVRVCVRACVGVGVCVGVWVCGCVGVWVCGCVGVWVCGCVGVYVYLCV